MNIVIICAANHNSNNILFVGPVILFVDELQMWECFCYRLHIRIIISLDIGESLCVWVLVLRVHNLQYNISYDPS